MRFTLALLTVLIVTISGCLVPVDNPNEDGTDIEPRQAMRDLVRNISSYGKSINNPFNIVTQNGNELLFMDEGNTVPCMEYIDAINGVAQEDLNFGYLGEDLPTPAAERDYLLGMLVKARDLNRTVMVTDYCSKTGRIDSSYETNKGRGFISFAADRRELDDIPPYPLRPYDSNTFDVHGLKDARNFLYLIDPEGFPDRDAYLSALRGTDHDLLIIDLFYKGSELTVQEVSSLREKKSGGSRLVICYMSIGEAEDYRYYWRSDWEDEPPDWLDEENPDWEGNYKVHYWDSDWQDIMYGSEGAYLNRIMNSGFDGVYLDIIDAFEFYET